jgi:hypothetical protein
VRHLAGGGQLAVPQFVRDLSRLRIAEVVVLAGLEAGERAQRVRGQRRVERQGLVRGDEAVPAEQGHEPGEAGCEQAGLRVVPRMEPQRGQVHQALPVGIAQRAGVAVQRGRLVEPLRQAQRHVGMQLADPAVAGPQRHRPDLRDDPHVDAGLPPASGRQPHMPAHRISGEGTGLIEVYAGGAPVPVGLIAQDDAPVAHFPRDLPALAPVVLELQQIGEVGRELQPQHHVD